MYAMSSYIINKVPNFYRERTMTFLSDLFIVANRVDHSCHL